MMPVIQAPIINIDTRTNPQRALVAFYLLHCKYICHYIAIENLLLHLMTY